MTAPLEPAGEVSYTPTTHRISKAKKGKKVHVCEFPGCNKVNHIALSLNELLTLCLGIHSGGAPQVSSAHDENLIPAIDDAQTPPGKP